MKKILIHLFIASLLVACDREVSQESTITILNKTVAQAASQFQTSFEKPRTEIEFANGVTATNCADYIKASQTSGLKEGVNNQIIKSEYLECDVLSLLGDKRFEQGMQNLSAGNELANRLDLRSFPSSLFRRLDENNVTLSKIGENHTNTGPTHVAYDTQDWFYRLEVVAIADLNNNNQADWVVWLTDEAKTGNYRSYQSLIIYDVQSAGEKLKAGIYPQTK